MMSQLPKIHDMLMKSRDLQSELKDITDQEKDDLVIFSALMSIVAERFVKQNKKQKSSWIIGLGRVLVQWMELRDKERD